MTPQDPNFPEDIPSVPPPRNGQRPVSDQDLESDQTFESEAGQPKPMDDLEGASATEESPGIVSTSAIADADADADAGVLPLPEPLQGLAPEDDRRPLDALPTEPISTAPAAMSDATPAAEISTDQTYRTPRAVPPLEDVWADTDVPYQPKELGVVDQLLLWLADGVTLWKRGLRWVRSQLPPNLQLSDGLLTAIALGLLIFCLALWNPLGSGSNSRVVASHDPLPRVGVEEPSLEVEAPTPLPAKDLADSPAVKVTQPPTPSPEQRLIADIQDRVSAISRSYGVGLIQSVEVSLPANTLGVNLAEAWYGLLTSQQNEIAQDIYHQAQGLNFSTLQLRDPDGVVVARNPVVGTDMVVLRRLRSAEAS